VSDFNNFPDLARETQIKRLCDLMSNLVADDQRYPEHKFRPWSSLVDTNITL